jgi:hypothetical protein
MRRQRTSPLVLGSRILEIMVGAVQLVGHRHTLKIDGKTTKLTMYLMGCPKDLKIQ